MTFTPVNRHLLIEPPPVRQERSTEILLPEDYTPQESEYTKVRILDWADDVGLPDIDSYEYAIVSRKMIQEIDDGDVLRSIVLENYVVGLLGAIDND
jgi:hypothetical protein